MDMQRINQIAYDWFGEKATFPFMEKGHKYHHGQRVAKLALLIRQNVLPQEDSHDELLTVVGWFHDCMHNQEEHAQKGADKARELLRDQLTPAQLDEMHGMILLHDRRDLRDVSDDLKIQQDADLLDHFGTFEVWIHFAYSIHHQMDMKESCQWLLNERPGLDEKYLRELHFDFSRKIYRERAAFIHAFARRMAVEAEGDVVGLL